MGWREEKLKSELFEINGFQLKDICNLDNYDNSTSERILSILLEWACYGQNEAGILLARRKITEIPRKWLKTHLLDVVKSSFEYTDDWNYRRLLELTCELLPELKAELLLLNAGTDNPDLIDVINDFK